MATIREWQKIVHVRNLTKGFYDYRNDIDVVERLLADENWSPSVVVGIEAEALARILADYKKAMTERKLLLVIGEICEAHEELRNGHAPTEIYEKDDKPEGYPIELADTVIRLLDVAKADGVDLESAIEQKHEFNGTRAWKHGRQF